MFHIGHLNLLKNAKKYCNYLIVGVNSDRLVEEYKHKTPVICEGERVEIVQNIKGVDKCFISDTLDKCFFHEMYKYDVIFIGDDWRGDKRWKDTEEALSKKGVDLIYLPYTRGVSSTQLTQYIKNDLE